MERRTNAGHQWKCRRWKIPDGRHLSREEGDGLSDDRGVEQTEVEQTGWNRWGEEAGENANNPGNMVFSPSAS